MKFSYELLIADAMQITGQMTDIKDAIGHMTQKQMYGAVETEDYTIVIVAYTHDIISVFRIHKVSEEVELIITSGLH